MASYDKVDYEKYESYIAERIVKKLLRKKIIKEEKDSKPFKMSLTNRLESGRGGPTLGGPMLDTTLNALKDKKVILYWDIEESYYNYGYYHSKPSRKRVFEANKEWFNKYISNPDNEKEPNFELKDLIEESNYIKKHKASDELSMVKGLNQFNYQELIYIHNHFDDFEIKIVETKRHPNITFFPKKLKRDRSKAVYRGVAKKFLLENFWWVLENVYGIKGLGRFDTDSFRIDVNPLGISYPEDLDSEKISKRLSKAKESLEKLNKALPYLEEFEKTTKGKASDVVLQESYEVFQKYMEENFPIHLNDKEKKLKQLAQWTALGKQRGKEIIEPNKKAA